MISYENSFQKEKTHDIFEWKRYSAGELIYIPKKDGTRQSWGNSTGIRKELDERNQMIREKKKNGCSLKELTEEFHLSIYSLKKILYH